MLHIPAAVNEQTPDCPLVSGPFSIRAVLGLEEIEGGEWSRLHGYQFTQIRYLMRFRAVVHMVCMGIVCLFSARHITPVPLGIWAAALTAIVIYSAFQDRRMAATDQRGFTMADLKLHARTTALKGIVWAGGIVLFSALADSSAAFVLWSMAALLILAAVSSQYSAPLAVVAFTVPIGLGGLIAGVVGGNAPLGIIAVATTLFGVCGVMQNARRAITARLAEMAIVEKTETVSMLLREFEEEGRADWLWQVDINRRLRAVSPRLAFALGKEPAEIEGKSFLQLVSGEGWKSGQFPPSLHALADKLKRRENFANLISKVSVEDSVRWWELSGTPIIDDSGVYQGFRGVGSDVTEQRESSEKIAYLARYDGLTSLPNRLMLNETLGEALRYSAQWRTRCAFMMIDLDRFKAVNDSLGHLIGDRLLAEVAGRLQGLMRDGELCGRLGGDEFGVVIRDATNKHRIVQLSNAIIDTLSAPYHIENHVLYVGASVGSAMGPRDGKTVEELLRNADLALYRAKDAGGGEYCDYEPSLHANAEERRQLEASLRHALERKEFTLHYQPVVDANNESIVSFEALVRWNSKEHGFVSPVKFVPIAEDTRLIVPIGQWVLQEACREAAANWPPHVKVNVNVSPEQLLEPDFAATVVRALSHSGLSPHRLEVEVTESIFLRDASVARGALEQVMALGCSVALDDFGTGYSSLGYLRKLRFSTIKVDRSFVQGAAQKSPESLAIIRAVVAMAESLDMTTTAEGVEVQEEVELVRSLGCTKIQGYHFGRPMPAEDVREVFKRSGHKKMA